MAVTTTGSTLTGLNDGMQPAMVGVPGSIAGPTIRYVNGDPDGIVTCPDISGLAIDVLNQDIYMAKLANGSTWFSIGSTT